MASQKSKTARIAAVQMESKNGLIDENLAHAVQFIGEAAQKGAKLIVLPEFMPTGYVFTKDIWNAGEPHNGRTVTWLKSHSKRLGVYLGTSFLEADGEDFFNTFVITNPDGGEAGRVRKQTPASFEAYFTKGEANRHIIETDFARIGVGICYENQLSYTPHFMHNQSVDLMLMPHSAPTPSASLFFPKASVKKYNDVLRTLPAYYSKLLGIPVMLINKCGPWNTTLPGLPFLTQRSTFPGLTAIADSDGVLKVQLGDREGIIVEDVTLDPARKTNVAPTCLGRWALDVPWAINTFRLIEAVGGAWYNHSSERKKRAREISSGK